MRRTLVATIATALMVLGLALPASARSVSSEQTSATAVAAAVPNCVSTFLDDSGYIDELIVYNDCNHDVRVKVVLAFARDFPCYTIRSKKSLVYHWPWPGRFDRLEDC